ncbi:hypothetical protein M885DRAFT_572764 [Pelagophyceae sp. CCMP2097]|nr:hypothetical protein M885DRAFT_572764 [Pelagophyceae sp. CCMP2097]
MSTQERIDELVRELADVNSYIALGVSLEDRRAEISAEIRVLILSRPPVGAARRAAKQPAHVAPPDGAALLREDAARGNAAPQHDAAPRDDAAPRVTYIKTSGSPTPRTPAKKDKHLQLGMASFFSKTTKLFAGSGPGKQEVAQLMEEPRLVIVANTFSYTCQRCRRQCKNPGALATHEKSCRGANQAAASKTEEKAAASKAAARGGATARGNATVRGELGDDGASAGDGASARGELGADGASAGDGASAVEEDEGDEDGEEDGALDAEPPGSKKRKRTTSGALDGRQGNRGATQRKRYPRIFQLLCLDKIRALKDKHGDNYAAAVAVAEDYGLCTTLLYPWIRNEEIIRATLKTSKHAGGKYDGGFMRSNSKAGKAMQLGGGRGSSYPLAEESTFKLFMKRRAAGLRIGPRILMIMMRRDVADHYDKEAASTFKAFKGWLRCFAMRWNISLRKKSNKKNVSAVERLPKVKRWLARFRRRLRRGVKGKKSHAITVAAAATEVHVSTAHRGADGAAMLAPQGSYGLANDCGLCALTNATVDNSFTLDEAMGIAHDLEAKLISRSHSGWPRRS